VTLPVTFFYDILRMNEYIPGGLRSASLHSGPSHCILRPANAGLVSSGPLPLPVSAGAHASGDIFIHPNDAGRYGDSLLKGLSTPGQGQGEGPIGSKLSRSDDADDNGRGRSERSERSPSGVSTPYRMNAV